MSDIVLALSYYYNQSLSKELHANSDIYENLIIELTKDYCKYELSKSILQYTNPNNICLRYYMLFIKYFDVENLVENLIKIDYYLAYRSLTIYYYDSKDYDNFLKYCNKYLAQGNRIACMFLCYYYLTFEMYTRVYNLITLHVNIIPSYLFYELVFTYYITIDDPEKAVKITMDGFHKKNAYCIDLFLEKYIHCVDNDCILSFGNKNIELLEKLESNNVIESEGNKKGASHSLHQKYIEWYEIYVNIDFYKYNSKFLKLFLSKGFDTSKIIENAIEMHDEECLQAYSLHLYLSNQDYSHYTLLAIEYGSMEAYVILAKYYETVDLNTSITYYNKCIKYNVERSKLSAYHSLIEIYIKTSHSKLILTLLDYYKDYPNVEKYQNCPIYMLFKKSIKVNRTFECPISLELVNEGYELTCGHVYSKEIFFIRDNACPLCRKTLI